MGPRIDIRFEFNSIALFGSAIIAMLAASGCFNPSAQEADAPAENSTSNQRADTSKSAEPVPEQPAESNAMADEREALEAIGYLSGVVEANEDAVGVVVHDQERAYQALNIFNSSHEPFVTLMTMDGELIHRWFSLIHEAFPNSEREKRMSWRRVRINQQGDLFAIHEGIGLLKLDKDSNLIWAQELGHHHDVEIQPDGTLLALTREANLVKRINPDNLILEDFIVLHAADGTLLKKVSLLECLENSVYYETYKRLPKKGDIFHSNDIEMLDGRFADRNPAFAKGNVMISILMLNAVAIVDMEKESIVWLEKGIWLRQHSPTMLDNGNILVYDNRGRNGLSQAVELNPYTQLIEWQYPPAGNPNKLKLYSETISTVQRLPNGNTLIVESNQGRALEVTPEHETVWEFKTPYRTSGEEGDEDLVANLPQIVRLPAGFPTDWADAATVSKFE